MQSRGRNSASWRGLQKLSNTLNGATTFAPLKSAVDGFSKCIDLFQEEAQIHKDYEQLKNEVDGLLADLSEYLDGTNPSLMTPCIETLARNMQKEVDWLPQEYQRPLGRFVTATNIMDAIVECYRRIQALLARLSLNINLTTWKTIEEQAASNHLRAIPYSLTARYRSLVSDNLGRTGCTPNTRMDVLQGIETWTQTRTGPHIYWLNGMAGTGKTTIAYSLCERMVRLGTLVASFFCTRQLPECRDVNRIIPSIAYQLSLFSRPLRYAVAAVLQRNPDVCDEPLDEQLDKLIVGPLKAVEHTLPTALIVVIDALDECDDTSGIGRMLDALLKHVHTLPVKFFVTSRPEPKILDRMQSGNPEQMRLHELDRLAVQEDIKTYLQSEIGQHMNISTNHLDRLVRYSGALFIYAATVVRYIGHDNFARSEERLATFLKSPASHTGNSTQEIDTLYTTILDGAFEDKALEEVEKQTMRTILHTVICASEPLTVQAIAELLGLKSVKSVLTALRPLLSVLHLTKEREQVATLHQSFPDFMLQPGRSNKYYCDARKYNAYLARRCFAVLKLPSPPFNICKLESSYLLDDEVPDLENRVKKLISDGLYYACRYWTIHLSGLDGLSEELTNELSEFLSQRYLLWLEIMNLKHNLGWAVKLLSQFHAWLQKVNASNFLQDISKCQKFAAAIESSPLSKSTPHIYVSALCFWGVRNPLIQRYRSRFPGLVKAKGPAMERCGIAPLLTLTTDSVIECVACAPDGVHVATGSIAGTISILNVKTGKLVTRLLAGSPGGVHSIAYSPDGTIIASGYNSGVRIWDVSSGKMIGRALTGHVGPVNSVAYSPDGGSIASGSSDCTILFWDVDSRQEISQPIRGHTNIITSICYSPDSAYIASGSHDHTIRRWDTRSGEPVGSALRGHDSRVTSLVYSPDGAYIASGSYDCTVRIWDAKTGQSIGQPLKGHTDFIYSVSYSPDGTYLASGSKDGTVHIWESSTGQTVKSLVKGYEDPVNSVAFASNSAYLVSGSLSGTVCIWDASENLLGRKTINDRALSRITSVGYSSCGRNIVSGTFDGIVQISEAPTMHRLSYSTQQFFKNCDDKTHIVSSSCSPCGRYVVSLHVGSYVHFRDLQAHLVDRISVREAITVTFIPNSARFAIGTRLGITQIWDWRVVDSLSSISADDSSDSDACSHSEGPIKTPEFDDNGYRFTSFCSQLYRLVGVLCSGGVCVTSDRVWERDGFSLLGLKGIYIRDTRAEFNSSYLCYLLKQEIHAIECFLESSYVAYSPGDGTICIYNARTGQITSQPNQCHAGPVSSLAFSPDGHYIVSGSHDCTVRFWNSQTGQAIGDPLSGHKEPVNSVAYSPDGEWVISGSDDGTIRIWKAPDRQHTLQGFYASDDSVFSGLHTLARDLQTILTDADDVAGSHGCRLDKEGWLMSNGKRILWIPSELRHALLLPQNVVSVHEDDGEWLGLDFSNACIGRNWALYSDSRHP